MTTSSPRKRSSTGARRRALPRRDPVMKRASLRAGREAGLCASASRASRAWPASSCRSSSRRRAPRRSGRRLAARFPGMAPDAIAAACDDDSARRRPVGREDPDAAGDRRRDRRRRAAARRASPRSRPTRPMRSSPRSRASGLGRPTSISCSASAIPMPFRPATSPCRRRRGCRLAASRRARSEKELLALAERWRPWRGVAAKVLVGVLPASPRRARARRRQRVLSSSRSRLDPATSLRTWQCFRPGPRRDARDDESGRCLLP